MCQEYINGDESKEFVTEWEVSDTAGDAAGLEGEDRSCRPRTNNSFDRYGSHDFERQGDSIGWRLR